MQPQIGTTIAAKAAMVVRLLLRPTESLREHHFVVNPVQRLAELNEALVGKNQSQASIKIDTDMPP